MIEEIGDRTEEMTAVMTKMTVGLTEEVIEEIGDRTEEMTAAMTKMTVELTEEVIEEGTRGMTK